MSQTPSADYDVVIMGGGPGGSTLGALLARNSKLRVALFEKERFPREHIGESFAHPLMPVLEESGSLAKVLRSECWVKKFGGVYSWDAAAPKVAFFDHANWLADGVHRFAIHVNRSEFDEILLDHAQECGVHVFEGLGVKDFESRGAAGCVVTLDDGRQVRAGWFVDASGRHDSIAAKQRRSWLSGYRNIAIWQHYLGGRHVQTLPGDWNIFREQQLSPIGCFAFQDGWVWYIPVPKIVGGRREQTHSIGIVTNPIVLKQPGKDFTDPQTFLSVVKQVPHLRELIQDVRPVGERMLTATNYSMINDRFADYDGRWILVGDASYFVDPLFSSGVAFAANQAAAAAMMLRHTADPRVPEQQKRDLWHDYDRGWHGMAKTFALSIDQWYHAIGKNNPGSVYWQSRGTTIDLGIHERTFDALLNTAFTPDLLQIITGGTRRIEDLDPQGPFIAATAMAQPDAPDPDALVTLAAGVSVRTGLALDVPGFKAFVPPPPYEIPAEAKAAIARYWEDPVKNGDSVPPTALPVPCHRFELEGRGPEEQVCALDRDGAAELWSLLRAGRTTFAGLERALSEPQRQVFKRLQRAGMIRVGRVLPTRVEAQAQPVHH